MNRLQLYLCLFIFTLISFVWSLCSPFLSAQTSSAEVSRGKYLVEEIARCSECHTPRDGAGNLKHEVWLQGAPIWDQADLPSKTGPIRRLHSRPA
jgi:mono/diheme cytochrome c family protein